MNPYQDLQQLVDQVPALVQPLIVALGGTIPYIEGEGAAVLGIIAGLPPVPAAVAAAAGNIVCVVLVVTVGARLRTAVVARRSSGAVAVAGPGGTAAVDAAAPSPAKPASNGQRRLRRWVARFGVPGASLICPLALPTQLTAATLVAMGVARSRVILWQVIAIALWTTAVTLAATGVLSLLTGRG